MPAVDRRSGRDAALGSICGSAVGGCLVDPLDLELTNGPFVDRPALETARVEIDSLRERRSLYRPQQQHETLPETEHECLLPRRCRRTLQRVLAAAVQRDKCSHQGQTVRKQKRTGETDVAVSSACEDSGARACYRFIVDARCGVTRRRNNPTSL